VKIGYGDGLIVRPWFEYALNGELIGKPSARFCALFFNGLPVNRWWRGLDTRRLLGHESYFFQKVGYLALTDTKASVSMVLSN
jgi:hypothetical protein